MASLSKSAHNAPVIRKPNQPSKFKFPHRTFGTKEVKRSFQSSWFEEWCWLDYREASDSVICLYCSYARENKLLTESLYKKWEDTYVRDGFTNWKNATTSFKTHEKSKYHIDAVKATVRPQSHRDIAEMLSEGVSEEKSLNSKMLLIICK